jgi:superfamily II DNA or RNA helicase
MELRPYQRAACDHILAQLEHVRATLLVLATGLGKTVTFAEVARQRVERGQRVLVVAHRGELLEQAAATLARFGLSVAVEQGERRADRDCLPDVVIASLQTLRAKRLETFAPEAFGLVIVDEAHHATAPSYRALLEYFSTAHVLGVTATPDRTDGTGLRNVFDSCAYRMDLDAGIRGGWLAPLELRSVIVDSLDLSQVRTIAGELHAGELEAELIRDRVLHEVAGPLAELSRSRQTLAFVAGVQQAHALAQVLAGYGVKAAAVDGSMQSEARAEVLDDYRAGRVQLVLNAMLLTEGFDCPETSCIALVRPTRSRSLLVQMIGRGTRRAEGKGACLVIDFVPGRAATLRLSSPADALAGGDLPEPVLERVRVLSCDASGELDALIAQARADEAAREAAELARKRAEELEPRRLVCEVGVMYAAPRLDVQRLLEAVRSPEDAFGWPKPPASRAQIEALRKAGFDVPDALDTKQARTLFNVLEQRRAAGLCTLKQAKLLRSYGLRDDLPFELARGALDSIAQTAGVRPSPCCAIPGWRARWLRERRDAHSRGGAHRARPSQARDRGAHSAARHGPQRAQPGRENEAAPVPCGARPQG